MLELVNEIVGRLEDLATPVDLARRLALTADVVGVLLETAARAGRPDAASARAILQASLWAHQLGGGAWSEVCVERDDRELGELERGAVALSRILSDPRRPAAERENAEFAVVTSALVLDLLNDATWSDVIDAAASLRDAAWYFRERLDAPLRS